LLLDSVIPRAAALGYVRAPLRGEGTIGPFTRLRSPAHHDRKNVAPVSPLAMTTIPVSVTVNPRRRSNSRL
jgi:hypothetical protein